MAQASPEAPPTVIIQAMRGLSAPQLGVLISGLIFFRSTERTFADII